MSRDSLVLPARDLPQNPDFWRVFSHSFMDDSTGPINQTGRIDALFRSAMDIEHQSWRKYSVSGATVSGQGRRLGGWSKALQRIQPSTTRSGPYAPDGGATLLCYGINDMGLYGGHLAAVRETMVDCHRAIISRARAARAYLTPDAAFAYGAGFTNNASGKDLGQGTVDRLCSATGGTSSITFTIPSDYKGEPIAFGFIKRPDAAGGTVTFSGTAGVTGTFNTQGAQGGLPAAYFANSYTVKRITNLTAANAGQTIIMTCTALGSSGNIFFDGGWLESLNPPPVIVCNTARLTAAGYSNGLYTNWTGTEAAKDANVVDYNTQLQTMVNEFDSMVQIADLDNALAKDATRTIDGIHPNEYGAGPCVDAMIAARNRLFPAGTAFGRSLSYNGPSPRAGALRRPRLSGYHYTVDHTTFGAAAFAASGALSAMPFLITEGRETYSGWSLDITTAGSTASVIRWAMYEDTDWNGYPGERIRQTDPTESAGFSLTASVAVKTQNFPSLWRPDPGLYWIVMKVDTQGTSQASRNVAPAGQHPLLPQRAAGAGTLLPIGWLLTGQGTAALPDSFPDGATLSAGPFPAQALIRA